MNYSRLALAALGGTVASFAFGFLVLWLVPALINEGHKYPAVFRPKEKMMTVMPIGLVATFISILVVAILREPEHRAETRSGTGCGLLRPVDYHRNSHRSYLQTPRYTIIVNISVVVLRLKA